ncbi:hydroxyisourate hydrolase [Gorgonomyces haynaldii]|nr:hydroxyisourate hydrolase [Gorgonomyces haynaldii]
MQRIEQMASHLKSPITTHILDTSAGTAAQGVQVTLDLFENQQFMSLGSERTNADGRCTGLMKQPLKEGLYRLTFETEPYFAAKGIETFYPFCQVVFKVKNTGQHYHVPLIINPFSYSTYRGT